jgi:hypothetical protein
MLGSHGLGQLLIYWSSLVVFEFRQARVLTMARGGQACIVRMASSVSQVQPMVMETRWISPPTPDRR